MNEKKFALVAGGTGNVGEGIVKTLLEHNYTTIVPGRSKAGLDKLASYCNHHPNLKMHIANVSQPEPSASFFKMCATDYPPLDIFVASLGGWRQSSSIVDLSWEEWQATLEDNLSSHFLCMKYGYPLLIEDGSFIHINGMGAEAVIPKAGPTVAAAAAQMRLALTLAAEQAGGPKKVYELVLGLVNTRSRNVQLDKDHELVTPEMVANYILYLHGRNGNLSEVVKHTLSDANAIKINLEK